MSSERFIELMTPTLTRFGEDLNSVLRMVEDPEIDDQSRTALAGALMHVISSGGAIPGVRGVLRHLGDVLCLRMVFEQVRERSPEAFAKHAQQAPQMLGSLQEELDAMQAYLGKRAQVLQRVVGKFPKLNHQGHDPAACVTDTEASTWLYDTVQEWLIDGLEFDEHDVARELKHVDDIMPGLEAKLR